MKQGADLVMFEYRLIRSKRKTIGIQITNNGSVVVRAPQYVTLADIEKILQSKREWVTTNAVKRRQEWEQKENFTLRFGDTVTLLGSERTLVPWANNRMDYDDDTIYIPQECHTNEQIRKAIERIYKTAAVEYLGEKVLLYAELMAVNHLSLKINNAKTIWGSCSGKNRLNFSWRLFFASSDIIDYVVIHELAHIKQHNHSKEFWDIVAEYCHDYKVCEDGLKELQRRLSKQAWL